MKPIVSNWRTSLVGLALVATGLYTGATAKQSWTESGTVIGLGLGMLFVKDAHNNTQQ